MDRRSPGRLRASSWSIIEDRGGQSQFSTLLELEPKSDRIQRAIDHANHNLRRELSVEELAAPRG